MFLGRVKRIAETCLQIHVKPLVMMARMPTLQTKRLAGLPCLTQNTTLPPSNQTIQSSKCLRQFYHLPQHKTCQICPFQQSCKLKNTKSSRSLSTSDLPTVVLHGIAYLQHMKELGLKQQVEEEVMTSDKVLYNIIVKVGDGLEGICRASKEEIQVFERQMDVLQQLRENNKKSKIQLKQKITKVQQLFSSTTPNPTPQKNPHRPNPSPKNTKPKTPAHNPHKLSLSISPHQSVPNTPPSENLKQLQLKYKKNAKNIKKR